MICAPAVDFTSLHCTLCPPGSIHTGLLVVLERAKLVLALGPLLHPYPLPRISSPRASHFPQPDPLLLGAQIKSHVSRETFLHQSDGFLPPFHLQVTLLHPYTRHLPLPESSLFLYGLCSTNSPPGGKAR